MNDYKLMTYYKNDSKKTKLLTKKQLKNIENRQLYALRLNNYNDIVDAKQKVIKIIDEKGLDSDDNKTSLDTALKVLPYIIPQKKAIEMQITHKTIENIIREHVEEAKVINENTENEEKTRVNIPGNSENSVKSDSK